METEPRNRWTPDLTSADGERGVYMSICPIMSKPLIAEDDEGNEDAFLFKVVCLKEGCQMWAQYGKYCQLVHSPSAGV
jgi:hypothetical protein